MQLSTKHPHFREFIFGFLVIALFMLLIGGCGSAQEEEAIAKLELAIQNLSDIPEVEQIGKYELSWSYTAYDNTCYYARIYIFYGTNLPKSDFLDTYTTMVASHDWKEMHDKDADTTSVRVFTKTEYDFMNVDTDEPTSALKNFFNYEKARLEYKTIGTVRVDYMLPQRKGC